MSEEKNLSELYTDEKQDSVDKLKSQAERLDREYPSLPFTARDVVMDVIFFFVTVAIGFGWGMLMMLIISFITLSYLHFNIKYMILISIGIAVGAGVYYVIKMVKKYRSYK